MFSHFVQNLGAHTRQSSDSAAPDPRPASPSRSSRDAPSSTGQLAESAMSNLRKSLAQQRPGSPAKSPPARAKSTLEDRLRASFAIGEVSNETTPAASSRVSPSTEHPPVQPATAVASTQQPMSPKSTPLPESRVSSPIPLQLHDSSHPLHVESPLVSVVPASPKPQLSQVGQVSVLEAEVAASADEDAPVESPSEEPQSQVDEIPTPEAEVASPPEVVSTPEVASPPEGASPLEGASPPEESSPPTDVDPPPEHSQPSVEEASVSDAETTPPPDESSRPTDVDALQERLKLVEQRFSDVSTSFKRLQAEKAAADAVLRELTPVETISDSQAFRDYVQNAVLKAEMFSGEIARLTGKLTTQDGRIEELRDTHRMESSSQSAQIDRLKKQLSEAEALLKASQGTVAQGTESAAAQKTEIDRLAKEVEQTKRVAKEEEEKRVKAISLLKTVRQKLVKAEKDRDDAQREAATFKEKEKADKEQEQFEKSKHQLEIATVNAERERAVAGLKAQFDREIAGFRERQEKETAMIRGQFELEAVTTKSSHAKEIATLTSRISSLEGTITGLTNDKNAFFDQLQLRQAEVESAQSHLDSLQSQNTELQYQLRESEERLALLTDELAEAHREHHDTRSREPSSSAEDVAQLLAATQAKYESKLADLRKNMSVVEKERNESEAQWSRKLREKVRENEELKQVIGSATKNRELDDGVVEKLKAEIKALQEQGRVYQGELAKVRAESASLQDVESSNKAQETETIAKISALEQLVQEATSREAQVRASNKTLREELRKVQSSAALLERQRNPGVGYWTSRSSEPSAPEVRTSMSSTTSNDSRVSSPAPSATPTKNPEEEVNLEYLRNVILQFLEHKEMRPNLVKVLSIILHFTPQETRRLVAKV